MLRTSKLVPSLAAVAVALAITACGSTAKNDAHVAAKGKLVFADNAPFPPMVNLDSNGTLVGFEPDLGAALGRKLGRDVEFMNVPSFDGIIPAVLSGRADVGIAYFEDRVDRRDKFWILDYIQGSPVYVVRGGNPLGVKVPTDLCGRNIAIQKGTQQQVDLFNELTASCASASKPKPTLLQLPKESEADLAVRSGRADAVLTDDLAGAAAVKGSKGTLQLAMPAGKSVVHGMLIPKQQTALRDALQKALKDLVADGTYVELIKKWGIAYSSYTKATVNEGG